MVGLIGFEGADLAFFDGWSMWSTAETARLRFPVGAAPTQAVIWVSYDENKTIGILYIDDLRADVYASVFDFLGAVVPRQKKNC